mgnify:CR=1 FL=1
MNNKLVSMLGDWAIENAPNLLTGSSIAIFTVGTVDAAISGARASKKLDAAKEEKGEELTVPEKLKIAAPIFIPTGICWVSGTVLSITSNRSAAKKLALTTALYEAGMRSFENYKNATREEVGAKKEQKIWDRMAANEAERVGAKHVGRNVVYETGLGDTICFDEYMGHYFTTSADMISHAVNECNAEMLHGFTGTCTYNEFYDELGVPRTGIGDDIGWNVDYLLDPILSYGGDDMGNPMIILQWRVLPRAASHRFH